MNKIYDIIELLIAVSVPVSNTLGVPIPYYTWAVLLCVRLIQYIFRSAEQEIVSKKLNSTVEDMKKLSDIIKSKPKTSVEVPLNKFYTN